MNDQQSTPGELWKQLYAHWLGMDEDETTLTCACGERFSAEDSKPEDWAKHVAAALQAPFAKVPASAICLVCAYDKPAAIYSQTNGAAVCFDCRAAAQIRWPAEIGYRGCRECGRSALERSADGERWATGKYQTFVFPLVLCGTCGVPLRDSSKASS